MEVKNNSKAVKYIITDFGLIAVPNMESVKTNNKK